MMFALWQARQRSNWNSTKTSRINSSSVIPAHCLNRRSISSVRSSFNSSAETTSVFAAADPLEISAEELREDHTEETDRLLKQCTAMTEEELMRDVFVEFQFDLCRACQRAYLGNPLGMTV